MLTVLIEKAETVLGEFPLSEENLIAGNVACAILTEDGNIYTGICLDLACGIGFCAEHAAVAKMLKARETIIDYIVAISANRILLPCGRCRELLIQVSRKNLKTKVIVDRQNFIFLSDLLPKHWLEEF
jgi:cytidine deaminase